MNEIEQWIEDNANLTLWCVHSLGPDDLDAAPSHAAAVERAEAINREVHGVIMNRKGGDNTILCFAYAAPWPWSEEDHAEAVKDWDAA